MSLTSYRAAPPRDSVVGRPSVLPVASRLGARGGPCSRRERRVARAFVRFGGDLLSHVLGRSTMGASGFHGRVRNGVGWGTRAIGHQVDAPPPWPRRGQAAQRFSHPGWGGGVVGKSCWHGWSRLALWWSLTEDEVDRAIRTGQLSASPRLHIRPIDVVVCHGPWARPGFAVGFPLRCVQRLSRPDLATRLRGWRHDRSTRGPSTPVLSY